MTKSDVLALCRGIWECPYDQARWAALSDCLMERGDENLAKQASKIQMCSKNNEESVVLPGTPWGCARVLCRIVECTHPADLTAYFRSPPGREAVQEPTT